MNKPSEINVRLSGNVLSAICNHFSTFFLPTDQLWLFGSRTDLNKKGGDIDLYIETNETNYEKAVCKKLDFLCALKKEIGDQKIDVVLRLTTSNYHLPIYDIARSEGVRLI